MVEDDLTVEDAITPISSIGSPRHPGPARLQGRRAHNNFVAAIPAPPAGRPAPVGPAQVAPGVPPTVSRGEKITRRPNSARPVSAKRRPNSAATVSSSRPGSAATAPFTRPGSSKSSHATPQDVLYGWWLTPDEHLLRTPGAPVEARRPAAEELQHELTMTASVLRTAQSRLAEEREQRLRARASEELALVDVRRAKEEAQAIKEARKESDRQLTKALMQQRKELEQQLQRQEDEAELKVIEPDAASQPQSSPTHCLSRLESCTNRNALTDIHGLSPRPAVGRDES